MLGVLEKVFETMLEWAKDKCVKCKSKTWNRRGFNSSSLEPRSMKRVRYQQNIVKGTAGGSYNISDILVCGFCKKRHPGDFRKKFGACFICGSTKHRVKDCPHLSSG